MIITLTTDFGTQDHYVAAMKGVILGIAPEANIVDVTHDIPPQDVTAGALCLEAASETFPKGTIHVAVIDPGVGTDRHAVAIATEHGTYVGPDNGLLTLAAERYAPWRAVRLTNARYHRRPTSHTFHGRDVFAPAAAHLAAGTPLADLGEPHGELVRLDLPKPTSDGTTLTGHVIHIDHFGNLITNVTGQDVTQTWPGLHPHQITVTAEGLHVNTISDTYSRVGVGQTVAYLGSSDRLEIAVRNGNAACTTGIARSAAIKLTPGR